MSFIILLSFLYCFVLFLTSKKETFMARKKKVKKFRQDRKWWFRAILKLIKLIYKKPNFVFMGDKPKKDAIVLTNHEGADVPLLYELYVDFPMRFWGTHEMNTSFRLLYKHLTKDYYHEIHGWNIHKARLFGLIATLLLIKDLDLYLHIKMLD